jgi:FkbM family methyltransferase
MLMRTILFLKEYIFELTARGRLRRLFSEIMPDITCIDVGASYYPHPKWKLFINSLNTLWIAVEPNEKNVKNYAESWKKKAKLKIVPLGLSEHGGMQKLYITNVDSGSSLLEPVVATGGRYKKSTLDYFFPMKVANIETCRLIDLIAESSSKVPIVLKLDTQGTELSIIRGAKESLISHQIIGIEMESTLLADPIMRGSGKFWQANQYMEEFEFELLKLDVICERHSKYFSYVRNEGVVNECDAVYGLKQEVIKNLDVSYKIAYMGFLASYGLYSECLYMTETYEDIGTFLSKHKIDKLQYSIKKCIKN